MPVNTFIPSENRLVTDDRLALYGAMPRGYTRGVSPIAINLLELRKRRGLTQEQVAARGQLKQSTVSKYERGHARPDLRSLLKLAVGLGLDLNAIIVGEHAEYDDLIQWQNKVGNVGPTPIDGSQQQADTRGLSVGDKETSPKEPSHVNPVHERDFLQEGHTAVDNFRHDILKHHREVEKHQRKAARPRPRQATRRRGIR